MVREVRSDGVRCCNYGEPETRVVRSDEYLPQASERRRPRGATGRFMNRLDLSMRAVSVRWLVGSLGAIAALAHGSLDPVGYAVIGYLNGAETLSVKADLSAARPSSFIATRPADWRADAGELARALEPRDCGSAPVLQRIRDAQGAIVLEQGEAPAARPTPAARRSWSAARRSAGPW